MISASGIKGRLKRVTPLGYSFLRIDSFVSPLVHTLCKRHSTAIIL
jgi:hypothetical protein